MRKSDVHKEVRKGYAAVARQNSSCCGGNSTGAQSCCCGSGTRSAAEIARSIGYSDEDIQGVPEGANLGLGCGNPIALASLQPGEVVLDLGSGAGFDCFLAASRVGPEGKVIGVDMTPEMLDKARENARKGKYKNVEFRLGEIEHLPVADSSVDVIISNCVINLSADKKQVFREAYRVLKPAGRLMVSDIVLLKELPEEIRNSVAAYVSCISGAIHKNSYLKAIKDAGFKDVQVVDESVFPVEALGDDPVARAIRDGLKETPEKINGLADSVASIRVSARKSKSC